MDRYYKLALAIGILSATQVEAQTHYGMGAGTQGAAHAFFGTNAGMVNLGSNNSFLGHESGFSNVDGAANTFVGSFAGYKTIDGNSNVFIGDGAGLENVSGNMNTYIGADAGLLNKDGGGNVAIGHQAQYFGKTGLGNCSIGYHAGRMAIGDHNVFLGSEAGHSNAGSNNTFMGYRAGYLAGIGDLNTFVGSETGANNTTGHHNTFFGEHSGYNNKEGFSNTFVGSESGYSSQTGVGNVFFGNKSGYSNTNGHQNVFLGYGAGFHNTIGQRNTYLGYGATGNPAVENATAIGSEAKVTANNSIVLGHKANVGIGVSAPSFQLHLSTDAAAKAGSPDWIVASDSRLKKNITDFTDGLELLKQIRPVWFQYNGQAGIETGDKKFVGIIAQEMQKIAPYTIGTFIHQDSLGKKTEYLDYDANAVTYILINAVKEVVEQKDTELRAMNKLVSEMSERLKQLEQIVASNTVKSLTGSAARTEPNANGVTLEQNAPNGFSGSSDIKYFIPQSVKEATIHIYSVNGTKVNSYSVKERGEGKLTISASDFENGVFLYDLVTDGKSNGVRKMVVDK
jgi:hypothetical protein